MYQKPLIEFGIRVCDLIKNRINGKLIQWLRSYLNYRKQIVTFSSCASSTKSILAGVPHGSVRGPLVFLIYINDIAKRLSV